jgi:hypothetical protein
MSNLIAFPTALGGAATFKPASEALIHMRSTNSPAQKQYVDGDNVVDINQAAAKKAAAQAGAEAKKSFTSEKLTWVNLLMMDHRQEPLARLIGIAIAQTINDKTRVSFASDRLIADRLGISVRSVVGARRALRDGEWLTWHKPKPRGPNHTKLVLTEKNVNAIEDHQVALRDRRDFDEHENGRKRRTKS